MQTAVVSIYAPTPAHASTLSVMHYYFLCSHIVGFLGPRVHNIALKEVYKYCHLVVVMVIELLANSLYNAVMSGRLLEAGHSLLCLYYELLLGPIAQSSHLLNSVLNT